MPSASWARTSSPSAESAKCCGRTDVSSRRTPAKLFGPDPAVILVLGTYWAQRPAFRRSWLHTAAHAAENQDHKGAFPLVRDANLRLQRMGRLGLEPRTGDI